MKRIIVLAAALAAATPAFAHVVVAPGQAQSGSYFAGTFRVGHGCQGQDTRSVRIEIPPEVASARPRAVPGWRHTIETRDGQVTAITWTGRLKDEEFQAFEILMKLPEGPRTLLFPTVQTCRGAEMRWTDPDPKSSTPAPRLDILPAGEAQHEHH